MSIGALPRAICHVDAVLRRPEEASDPPRLAAMCVLGIQPRNSARAAISQPLTVVLNSGFWQDSDGKITIFLLFKSQWNACLAHPRKTKSELGVGLTNISIIGTSPPVHGEYISNPTSRKQRFKASLSCLNTDPALPRRLYSLPEVAEGRPREHWIGERTWEWEKNPQTAFPPAHTEYKVKRNPAALFSPTERHHYCQYPQIRRRAHLSLPSIGTINTMSRSDLGKKGSAWLTHPWRSGQELEAETEAEGGRAAAAFRLLPVACSACFSHTPPGQPTASWAFPYQS